jgi:sugar phosphate isomerase/epimerase
MARGITLFRSLWTNGGDLDSALAECEIGLFEGIEGPVPDEAGARREFAGKLRSAQVPFIAEMATGGGYVPGDKSMDRHLEDFCRRAAEALACGPLFLNVLGGCDCWTTDQSVDFFGLAMDFAADLGVTASFETHRGRPTRDPWSTRELLERLPDMRLTCDFSHWCCVCERLVLDSEPEILALCAARARHVHARVGYAQGPQVPHPAAPEFGDALAAHERWWDAIWDARPDAGHATMTPEFGPDGYLQAQPFTGAPAADLDEINRWMAVRQRDRFLQRAAPAAASKT